VKTLVTGAGGFIGSHLCEMLIEKGNKVKAFVKYNSQNLWGWLENSSHKEEMEVISGDIRDYDSVKDAMKGVDVVFHLAALIGIPYSYISPLAYVKTNIEGTYKQQGKRTLKKLFIPQILFEDIIHFKMLGISFTKSWKKLISQS